MGSKKKNTATVQEPAPVAAPAEAPEPQAPEENTEDSEAEHPHAEKIAKCKDALKSFPSLLEGYICAKGVYFVRDIAEKALEEGEELIIVTLEK